MSIRERCSYGEIDHWRKYQPFLPERLRLSAEREPAEEWWLWREADIHLDRFAAPAAPLTVILLHGGGGNSRLVAPYGLMLQGHGYEVVMPDLPGYGLSVVPTSLITYPAWVECVSDLLEAEIRRTGRPVALAGLSMGGYLAYLAAAQSRKAAGVIATTLADFRLQSVREEVARFPLLNRLATPLLGPLSVRFGGLRLPMRWFGKMASISNTPEISRLGAEDPLGGGSRVPLRFLHSTVTIRPAIEPENFDVCPVLLAHPAADTWTKVEASLPVFGRIKGPKELVMLENCGHLPIEEPGLSQLEEAAVAFLRKLVQGKQPTEALQQIGQA